MRLFALFLVASIARAYQFPFSLDTKGSWETPASGYVLPPGSRFPYPVALLDMTRAIAGVCSMPPGHMFVAVQGDSLLVTVPPLYASECAAALSTLDVSTLEQYFLNAFGSALFYPVDAWFQYSILVDAPYDITMQYGILNGIANLAVAPNATSPIENVVQPPSFLLDPRNMIVENVTTVPAGSSGMLYNITIGGVLANTTNEYGGGDYAQGSGPGYDAAYVGSSARRLLHTPTFAVSPSPTAVVAALNSAFNLTYCPAFLCGMLPSATSVISEHLMQYKGAASTSLNVFRVIHGANLFSTSKTSWGLSLIHI